MATKKSELVLTCNATAIKDVMKFLDEKLDELIKKRDQLNAKGQQNWTAQDKKNFKQWGDDIAALTSKQQKNREEMVRYGEVMKDLAGAKTKDLKRALGEVKRALDNMSARDPRRAQLEKDLKKIQNQVDANTVSVKKNQSAWGSLGTTLKNLVAYAGVFAMFNRLKSLFGDFVTLNRELSDQLANIRKVSGLAMQDIYKLEVNLAKIDTRSSIQQLNELAYAGAKLGFGNLGTEALEGFVKSALKVQNALKEDMGEDSMTALSKLVEVMGLIPKMGVERAMDAAGSAIFKLASTSTATGTNIIEFTKRLMGLANVSHVTTSELLALGSASDSMGLMAEVSSTAFTKMFTSIQSNYAGIEKAVGLAQGTLKNLLDQGRTMDALVEVFDKMHGMSMEEMKARGIFKELGSEGSRMNNVMTTMANKIDMLRQHLITSNEAFEDATAVAKEYEIQMDTAQAYAERASNIFAKAFVNPEGVDVVKDFSKAWYEVAKSLTANETFMFSIQISLKGILLLLKGIMTILPELLAMVISGAAWAWITRLREGEGLLTSLTAWFGKLTAAQKAFFKAAGWVGLALTVYEVGKAFTNMANNVKKANEYMKGFNTTLSNVNKEQYTAVRQLDGYVKAINEATVGTNQRKAAINNFNKVFKPYLSALLTEKSTVHDVADAYQEVVKQMKAKIALQAKEKDIEKFVNPRLQWEADKLEAYDKSIGGTGNEQYNGAWLKGFVDDARAAGKSISDIAKELNNKIFHLDSEAYANVYEQRDKTKVRRYAGTTTMNTSAGAYSVDRYETLGAQTAESQLQKAIQYAMQSYSTSNAISRINKKYKPWESAINEIQATEEVIEPYTPTGDTGGNGTTKAPEWMVEEKKEAEKKSKAVIGSIEEFYRLQEAAANELAANGQLTGEDFNMLIKHIQDRKDKMLLEARRAIAGDPNEFETERKKLEQDLVKRDDAVSRAAIDRIQEAEPAKAGAALRKYNGSKDVYGLDSNAFLNDIRKNAAQNELNIQRRQAAVQKEIDKLLLQYRYVEQAQRDFGDKLVQMGLITDGYQKVVQQLADGTEIVANTNEVQGFANKVVGLGSSLYAVNPESTDQLKQLMQTTMTTNGTDKESFAAIFPNYDEWMKQPEQYKEQMQAMYELMIQYEGIYYDKLKQRDDMQNKRLGSWWEHSDQKKENDQKLRDIQLYDFQYNTMHEGETMGFMMGLTNDLTHDPEVMREQAVLEQKIDIWKKAKEEREANLISEQVYQDKLRDMQDQTMAYTQKVMENLNKRIGRIKNFVKPVETTANSIGKKLGDMIFNMQSEEATWEQIWKNMALAVAESMLTMAGQYAQNAIVKASMNRAEETEEGAHATVMTMWGISEGAAKTIGTLGWIGIALIPVITSLLMGLLTSALSTKRDSGNSTTVATPKTKLVSGMLTYDKGNVQRFIGQDGKVYTATEEPAPKDGLVTHPIATTVQGQPALVAENGPEIVLGRETTKAIMMNEPELIRYLANYQKNGGGYRPYDSGNLGSEELRMKSEEFSAADNSQSSIINGQLLEVMQGVLYYLQNPIPPEIAMYDTGGKKGLHSKMKEANSFMARYGG